MMSNAIDKARAVAWGYASSQRAGNKDAIATGLDRYVSDDSVWRIAHPINTLNGREELKERFWLPFLHSFERLERRDDIFVAGAFNDKIWVASTGYFIGAFVQPWLNIAPTRQATFIRFGEILEIENGLITGGHLLLDIVNVARQSGVNLVPPGLGTQILAPAPALQDGVRLSTGPARISEKSGDLVEAMIAGLMRYDGQTLESMGQKAFWSPDMLWYGPDGIGATKGLNGFEDYHQRPFLAFVPNRIGGNHVARIADGEYVASGGWPSIRATTSGADWISTPLPAGRDITMRVMDFWRRQDDRLKENWVFIDIPDVFRQCGIDVFEQLHRH